jgi:O-antigen ligase
MTNLLPLSDLVRVRIERLADWLAVGVAVSLPWSTSATAVFIALWFVARVAVLNFGSIRRELKSAAGGLPVLLWLLAALGTLWADVPWGERVAGLGGFDRLLCIPLLLAQFRRSERGNWVLYGLFASVLGVLLLSWGLVIIPKLPWRAKMPGVPVKDYILQSTEFLICAFVLLGSVFDGRRMQKWQTLLCSTALAALFLANIAFVVTGRTALLVVPVLALLLGWRVSRWKGLLGAALTGCIIGLSVWLGSSYLRERLHDSMSELQTYRDSGAWSSTGLHLEFLKKSLRFVATAPAIGHGTGSIAEQFRNAVVGETGAASYPSNNPHNQVFAVAIQLGLIGASILLAMWISHFMLFRGSGLAAWIGTIVVVESVVSSLVNSNLFDFSEGWLYVFGIGVAGGIVLRSRDLGMAEPSVRKL